jgi:hypothetical protein
MDKIEEFENNLKELGCILIEPAEYPNENLIKIASNDIQKSSNGEK